VDVGVGVEEGFGDGLCVGVGEADDEADADADAELDGFGLAFLVADTVGVGTNAGASPPVEGLVLGLGDREVRGVALAVAAALTLGVLVAVGRA
jgi:hypothetical protein